MKTPVGAISLGTALLGSFLFLSGVGGLLVDYVPTVALKAVAIARDRAYLSMFAGVLVMVVSAGLAGHALRVSPKLFTASAIVLTVASIFPLGLWLLG